MKQIAFIVTVHWSQEIRPYGMDILNRLIDSMACIKYPYRLYIIDNQSEFKLQLPKADNITYLRIDDQYKLGLTGAWNLGLYTAFKDNNDILINCNDDLFFNSSINKFIEYIQLQFDSNKIYSALTDGVLSGKQKGSKPESGIIELSLSNDHDLVNGFFFAFTKEHYEKYCYQINNYFPIDHVFNGGDGKWGGQEGYWLTDKFKTVTGVIIKDTFISHTKYRSWKMAKEFSKRKDQ